MRIGEIYNAIGYLEKRSGIRDTTSEFYFCPDLDKNEIIMRADINGETIIERFNFVEFEKALSRRVWLEKIRRILTKIKIIRKEKVR